MNIPTIVRSWGTRIAEGHHVATPRTVAHGLGMGRSAWLLPLDLTFAVIGLRYRWLKAFFDHVPAEPLMILSRRRAERAAFRAVEPVPTYQVRLGNHGIDVRRLVPWGILSHLSETDKQSYVDRHAPGERCLSGRIPFLGATIDESSGAKGKAKHLTLFHRASGRVWVRGCVAARTPCCTLGSKQSCRQSRSRCQSRRRSHRRRLDGVGSGRQEGLTVRITHPQELPHLRMLLIWDNLI